MCEAFPLALPVELSSANRHLTLSKNLAISKKLCRFKKTLPLRKKAAALASKKLPSGSRALIRTSGRVRPKNEEALKSGARETFVRCSIHEGRLYRGRPAGSASIKSGVINDSARNKTGSSSRIPAARGASKTFCRTLLPFEGLITD